MKRIPDRIQDRIWTWIIVITMLGYLFGMAMIIGGK